MPKPSDNETCARCGRAVLKPMSELAFAESLRMQENFRATNDDWERENATKVRVCDPCASEIDLERVEYGDLPDFGLEEDDER